MAGHRVLLSYDGQPVTCYGCGEADHMYSLCPSRQRRKTTRGIPTAATYASIVTSAASAAEQKIEGMYTEVKYTMAVHWKKEFFTEHLLQTLK